MKNILFILLTVSLSIAQVPSDYYSSASGLSGYALKTELKNIISANYNGQTYNDLRVLYETSDNDEYYDNGNDVNTILDIYSENPNGQDPYNFSRFNVADRCGNYSGEGDCHNREHIFPQGFFNQNEPMRSDAHHVVPTDGFVNGGRSNLPFGEVNGSGSGITTYQNGSRRGPSNTPGFTGTVFEPIDEFKGDVARMLLYFATRYEDNFNDNSWDSPNATNDPRDGSRNRFYEQWYIDLLIDWHLQDPVAQREIDRNNDVYDYQNNANPFIDNPQYVTMIWTSTSAPSGSLFAKLTDTYVDVNSNGFDAGDEIRYDYTIENLGNTTLFNVDVTAVGGNFQNTVTPIASLNAGQVLTNPFGILTYVITDQNLPPANTLCFYSNQLSLSADFNSAGSNGSVSIMSDDPSNPTNVDQNNDQLPDDATITNVCGSSASAPTELFISEYIEGSGTNKAIEIANFTGNSIDLSNYTIQRNANGGSSWSGSVALTGTLADGEVHVMARGNADQGILDETDQLIGSGLAFDFNGNDPVGLFNNGILIDVVGSFNGGSADFAENVVLVRKDNAVVPNLDFNLTRDWNSFPQDDYSHLGDHEISTLSIDTSIIDNTTLYPNPSSDGRFYVDSEWSNLTIQVYDLQGRSVSITKDKNSFIIEKSGMFIAKISDGQSFKSFKVIVR
jgi:endonuclease I